MFWPCLSGDHFRKQASLLSPLLNQSLISHRAEMRKRSCFTEVDRRGLPDGVLERLFVVVANPSRHPGCRHPDCRRHLGFHRSGFHRSGFRLPDCCRPGCHRHHRCDCHYLGSPHPCGRLPHVPGNRHASRDLHCHCCAHPVRCCDYPGRGRCCGHSVRRCGCSAPVYHPADRPGFPGRLDYSDYSSCFLLRMSA